MKILVFTNYDSLSPLKNNVVSTIVARGTLQPNNLGILLKDHKIVCKEGVNWIGYKEIPELIESNFILIRDDMTFQDFNTLSHNIYESEYYVIYHRKPNDREYDTLLTSANWVKGQHEPGNFIYQPIADIIAESIYKTDLDLSTDINEKLSLSKSLVKRKKLNFLYSIYNGDTTVLSVIPYFLFPFKDTLKESIKWLSENIYSNHKDLSENEEDGSEQRRHLILLRDAILE